MLRQILVYGTIAGIIVGGALSATTITMHHNPPSMTIGLLIGYSSMLIALSAIFIAIKRRRDRNLGGVIKFLPAFGLGLGISVVAGLFYVLSWEAAQKIAGLDYGAQYAKHMIEEKEKAGVSVEELDKVRAAAAKFQTQYADPAFRLPMTFIEIFPVGVLVSLISAGLLRNPRFLPART